jgi:hypothetical protein
MNVRWIKNEVDAPPPKDCNPILAQIRKSFQIVGKDVCDFIEAIPVILLVNSILSILSAGQQEKRQPVFVSRLVLTTIEQ